MLNLIRAKAGLHLLWAMMQRPLMARSTPLSWSRVQLHQRLQGIVWRSPNLPAPAQPQTFPSLSVLPPAAIAPLFRPSGDPKFLELTAFLEQYPAKQQSHDVGSFEDHLIGTWQILSYWQQPLPLARCGLFHSVYATDAYPIALIPATDRSNLAAVIGDEAEALVLLFCTLDRRQLRRELLVMGHIPPQGLEVSHWMTQERLHLSPPLVAAYLVLEAANIAEQTCAIAKKPGLWMSRVAQLLGMVRPWLTPPPVFEAATQGLHPAAERQARTLYHQAQEQMAQPKNNADLAAATLLKVVDCNPWIAEPYLDLAILACQANAPDAAKTYAQQALDRLLQWGTAWDKRRPWEAMVGEALALQQG